MKGKIKRKTDASGKDVWNARVDKCCTCLPHVGISARFHSFRNAEENYLASVCGNSWNSIGWLENILNCSQKESRSCSFLLVCHMLHVSIAARPWGNTSLILFSSVGFGAGCFKSLRCSMKITLVRTVPATMLQPVGYRWEGGVVGYWSEHGDWAVGYR